MNMKTENPTVAPTMTGILELDELCVAAATGVLGSEAGVEPSRMEFLRSYEENGCESREMGQTLGYWILSG